VKEQYQNPKKTVAVGTQIPKYGVYCEVLLQRVTQIRVPPGKKKSTEKRWWSQRKGRCVISTGALKDARSSECTTKTPAVSAAWTLKRVG